LIILVAFYVDTLVFAQQKGGKKEEHFVIK
jgi:hypothetical protein